MLRERLGGSQGHRDGSETPRLLSVQLLASVRVDAADVDDAGLAVDVGTGESNPLLGAKAGEAREDRKRPEGGGELSRDGRELAHGPERENFPPLRLGGRDGARGSSLRLEPASAGAVGPGIPPASPRLRPPPEAKAAGHHRG